MDLNKSELFCELLSFFEKITRYLEQEEPENDLERKELYEKSCDLLKVFNLSSQEVVTEEHAYLNMNIKAPAKEPEQLYDYCAFESTDVVDSKVCPYSKLSPADLTAENPAIVAAVIQLDRKSLFGKPKPVHAALIGRWLLIYLSQNDKKPTQVVHVSKYEAADEKLSLLSNKGKGVKFQLSTAQIQEWTAVLEKCLQPTKDRHSYVNVVDKRKLPTPPESTFRPKSSKSDDIYEEPDLLNRQSTKSSELYKNVDSPPALPEKRGQRSSLDCEYDVPRNNKPTQITEPKSPEKSPEAKPKIISKANSSSPVKNSEEIRAKLLQQGIILTPLPEREPEPLRSPSRDYSRQSIRNWFRNKLNRPASKEEKQPKSEETKQLSGFVGGGTSKMGRVNAIIQQLETSKHFLKKRHTMYDDSYEPVNHESISK